MTTATREVLLYAPRLIPAARVTVGDSVALGHDVAGEVYAADGTVGVVTLRIHTREGSCARVELAPDATVFVWRNTEESRA